MRTKVFTENLICDVDYHITMSYDGNSDFESVVHELIIERINKIKRMNKYEKSELEINLLANSIPDVIIFKDAEGRWINANQAILQCLSLKEISFRGKTDLELASEIKIPSCSAALLVCMESDNEAWAKSIPIRIQENITLADGSTRVYDVTKIPRFMQDGSRKGLVIMGVDITDQV